MTHIAETVAPTPGSHLVAERVLMLSIGLVGIFRIIHKQQKMIHALEERLGK